MKKFLGIIVGLAISVALAMPASAFVVVFGDVDKYKDIDITEWIVINKTVIISVDVTAELNSAAEALAVVNQENICNTVMGFNPELADEAIRFEIPEEVFDFYAFDNFRTNTITGSILTNVGIVGVNQDSGNFNNQGNNYAVAVTDTVPTFANSESSASQINAGNEVRTYELFENAVAGIPQKTDDITNSVNLNKGIVSVNQSVGNMNNQLNSVALAVGLAPPGEGVMVAMAEADLGQFNAFNTVVEINTIKADTITGSINNNHGITSVNQAAGNMNNQASIVSLSVAHALQ